MPLLSSSELEGILVGIALALIAILFIVTFWPPKVFRGPKPHEEDTLFVKRPFQANGRAQVKTTAAIPVPRQPRFTAPLAITSEPSEPTASRWLHGPAPARRTCNECRNHWHKHGPSGHCYDPFCSCPIRPVR